MSTIPPEQPVRRADSARQNAEPPHEAMVVINPATLYYFIVAVVFFIAGFVVAWVAFTTTSGDFANQAKLAAAAAAREAIGTAVAVLPAGGGQIPATETPVPRQNIEIGDAPVWGKSDAKVTIVEFSDFECVFCERFFNESYTTLKVQYGDKVKFVFKHFPIIEIHPNSVNAALAAECAREQEKFWEYHDMLFRNQNNLTRAGLLEYARAVKIPDEAKFTQCYDTQKYAQRVQNDIQAGLGYSVRGTPTFFISGNILVGAQPLSRIKAAIDQALREAGVS